MLHLLCERSEVTRVAAAPCAHSLLRLPCSHPTLVARLPPPFKCLAVTPTLTAHLPPSARSPAVLEELETDSCASVPPQLAAATSLTGLRFVTTSDAAQFELTASGLDALLALPRLTLLSLPRLSEGGQRAAEQLRSAQPGLHVLMIPD